VGKFVLIVGAREGVIVGANVGLFHANRGRSLVGEVDRYKK
jgi:hypothetical protein